MDRKTIENYFGGDYTKLYSAYIPSIKNIGNEQMSALCPFHDDRNPSLSINKTTGLFHCFGCGQEGNIYDFYASINNLDTKSDFPKILNGIAQEFGIPDSTRKEKPKVIARYDYKDESGNLLYQIEKFKPKSFKIRQPDGKGGWLYKKDNVRIVPYHLPEIRNASKIIIVEGEKDADKLIALGITATTNPFGAGKWLDDFRQYFEGKKVILISDNDEPGRQHMHKVANSLQGQAASIRWLDLPDLPEKGDISDFIESFSSKEEAAEKLAILIEGAEEYKIPDIISDQTFNSDSEQNSAGNSIEDDINDAVQKYNEKHAVIMVGGKCLILNEIIDPTFDRPDISFSSTHDFKTYYQNKKIQFIRNDKVVHVRTADLWLDSTARKQYEGIVFDPSQKSSSAYYNLYRGLAVKSISGSWERMKNHIHEIICSGDDESFRYIMAWLARIVQYPGGKRPGVVIVLRGKQGTGKGCFANNFGAIFGNHFLHIISYSLLAGRFNSHFKDALLVFVDEGYWRGDKEAEGALKGLITEDYITIEAKHKDAFNIKNHANFIFASNSDWIVPASMEERRFFTIDVSDKRIGDRQYFKSLFEEMENGGREAMLYDLLRYDIRDYDLLTFPRSEALADQILHSMSSVIKFWFEQLRDGCFSCRSEKLQEQAMGYWPDSISCKTLYELYIDFAVTIGERERPIQRQFGKQLKDVCPGIKRKKFNREWHYYLPELSECRENFDSKIKNKFDWDSDNDGAEGMATI